MKCYLGKRVKSPIGGPTEVSREESFPTLYLRDLPEKLPPSGTMTIRFRVARITEELKEDCITEDVDVVEILSVKPEAEKVKSKFEEGGEALDKLKSDVEEGAD